MHGEVQQVFSFRRLCQQKFFINADFECNPLAAPYLEDIIKKIKDGGKPDNQKVYVDEACFACDDTVSSFKTDEGKEITMTVVDDKVLKERAY